MRQPKKRIAFPRRTWKIKPATRVKESANAYTRARARQDLRKARDEE
jgi:hypothetical protein